MKTRLFGCDCYPCQLARSIVIIMCLNKPKNDIYSSDRIDVYNILYVYNCQDEIVASSKNRKMSMFHLLVGSCIAFTTVKSMNPVKILSWIANIWEKI